MMEGLATQRWPLLDVELATFNAKAVANEDAAAKPAEARIDRRGLRRGVRSPSNPNMASYSLALTLTLTFKSKYGFV